MSGREPADEPSRQPEPVIPDAQGQDVSIDTVGAWAGRTSMSSPAAIKRDVSFAKSIGLKRLDIIVNDHAAWRSDTPFDTYDTDRIVGLADAAISAGLEIHLMSWLMPHRNYIDRAAPRLRVLVERTGARSIIWDCEEPWTQARGAINYADAAAHVYDAFHGIVQGVTGIGYAPVEKLGPICKLVDYVVPQCYSTSSTGVSPSTVAAKFASRWRKLFRKPVVIGLAAYRQRGIKGFTEESALRAAFGSAESDPEARTVIYWSLGQIRASRTAARTIRSLTHVSVA